MLHCKDHAVRNDAVHDHEKEHENQGKLNGYRPALTSARIRYQNGVLDYDTVLSLLLKVQQLDRTHIREQATLLTLQTGLCRALGKGWRTSFPDPSQ